MAASNTSPATEEERALGHMVASCTSTATEEEMASKKIMPDNIITMILKRLPVKSLIRFKSASKSFRGIISSPEFIMVHSLYNKSKRSPQLLFIHDVDLRWEGMNFELVYKFCTTDLRGNILSVFNATLRQDPIRLMLPSSLGLFCIATEKGIWLCNPSIRGYFELPTCPSLNPGDDRLLAFGFGYLVPLNEFMVVQLMLRANCLRPKIDCWVFTHTISSRSWRLIRERCPYLVPELSRPAFVKETIYWKINRRCYTKLQRDNDFLVAFNIWEEKFRVITHPVGWTYTADSKVDIAEIAGSLFMMEILDSSVNIWRLTDENNCIWLGPKIISATSDAPERAVRVAELRSYAQLNRQIVFSSSQENVVLLYRTRRGTFSQVELPFAAADFTTYFEGLYSLRD